MKRSSADKTVDGDSIHPIYKHLQQQYQAMRRRARSRENCEVLFNNYLDFKMWALDNGWVKGCCVCRNGDTGDYSKDNTRIDTKQSNVEEAHSIHYWFTDPTGVVVEIYNLSKFCRENKLNRGNMLRVLNGERNHHKGWTYYPQQEKK